MTFDEIIAEGKRETEAMDREAGYRKPTVCTKRQRRLEKDARIDRYRLQWHPQGDQGEAANEPMPGTGIEYEVDEPAQNNKEIAFCRAMVAVGIMDAEDFV